jgi:hypothetical protein
VEGAISHCLLHMPNESAGLLRAKAGPSFRCGAQDSNLHASLMQGRLDCYNTPSTLFAAAVFVVATFLVPVFWQF